jgi:acyl-coenzyme A synthetase/AMP-(fatty) acid ligase/thioesterase domain-containing protein
MDRFNWLEPPDLPLDLNGPVGCAFDRFSEAAVQVPVHELFAEAARRRPSGIAIDDGRVRLSYAEVLSAARRLGAVIHANTPRDGAVGVALPNTPLLPVSLLACMAAGRPAVPVDIHQPAQRCADILRAAWPAVVLVDPGATPDEAVPDGVVRLDVPRLCRANDEPRAAGLPTDISTADPAVVLYTSGSTGQPKGIVNNQRSLLQRVVQYVNACHLNPDDSFLTLSSSCTIAGLREALTALLSGGSLHMADLRRDGLDGMLHLMEESRITVYNSVPAVLRSLLRSPGAERAFGAVRVVRVGGDVVFWSDVAELRRRLPRSSYIQIGFSSTEATGTQWFVPAGARADGPRVPVGYALPGNRFALAGEDGASAPEGGVGELVLRGRFLALGHWSDGRCAPGPMRPDPDDPESRVFATGDRMRLRPDGLLDAAGRVDAQMKIRGQRVEPSEVEAVLRGWPEVADAAVVTRRDRDGEPSLVAFLVGRDAGDGPGLAGEARARLGAALPAALRPARLHLLEAIPRLPSAKPDLRALERLDAEAACDDTAAARPRRMEGGAASPEVATAVARAWRRVLGRRSLAADLPFDAAGGDSLKLLRLVYEVEQRIGTFTFLPMDLLRADMRPSDMVRAIGEAERAGRHEARAVAGDARPLVFLAPGLNGDEPLLALFRAELAPALRCAVAEYPDWPAMARQGFGFGDLVEAVAAQVEPGAGAGPVRLAGYSFGGHVAFAAAVRLRQRGCDVRSLCLLDTSALGLTTVLEGAALRAAVAGQGVLRQSLRERRLEDGIGMVLAETLSRPAMAPLLRRLARAGRSPPLPLRGVFAFRSWLRTLLRAGMLRRWRAAGPPPRLPDVPVTLFRSAQHGPEEPLDLGWAESCPLLRVIEVPGSHHSMFDGDNRRALCARFLEAHGMGPAGRDAAPGCDAASAAVPVGAAAHVGAPTGWGGGAV